MSHEDNINEIIRIREWAPLTVFDKIPEHTNSGPFSISININCFDVVEEFIALGSDTGYVYWYNRHTGKVQKLTAETKSQITCIKIVDSVDYMVAAGNSSGQVNVFQIQKEIPAGLNLVVPSARIKPIHHYTVRDLHNHFIVCCEWSKNGMKLYSGDRSGVVVLTELDYQLHIIKSVKILSEAYEIVQLSVCQSHLLVSTLYRCVVCKRNDESGEWCITQIGKKDRKQLLDCGGIFLKQSTASLPEIISGRPGWRFWLANSNGEVSKTLLFKDAMQQSSVHKIPLLNPKDLNIAYFQAQSDHSSSSATANSFRNIYLYAGDNALLVTRDKSTIYILNIDKHCVEAKARGFRNILDFCVCGKEIFVLERGRSLIRLSFLPEKPNKHASVIFNPLFPPPVPSLGAIDDDFFESPVEIEPEAQNAVSAEECLELPPIEKLNLNVAIELGIESRLADQKRRQEIFRKIGEMDFEHSILYRSSTGGKGNNESGCKKREPKPAGIVEIGHESKETSGQRQARAAPVMSSEKLLNFSSLCREIDGASTSQNKRTAFTQHLPEPLSPNSLQKTIAATAKSLAVQMEIPEVELAPITFEEFLASQSPSATTASTILQTLEQSQPSTSTGHRQRETSFAQQSPSASTASTILQTLEQCQPSTSTGHRQRETSFAQQSPSATTASTILQTLEQYRPSTSTGPLHNESTVLNISPLKKPYNIAEQRQNRDSKPAADAHCRALLLNKAHGGCDSSTMQPRVQYAPPTVIAHFDRFLQINKSILELIDEETPAVEMPADPESSDSNIAGDWEFLDN